MANKNRELKLRKVRNKNEWIDKTNGIRIAYNPFFSQYDASMLKGCRCFAFGKTFEEVVENVKNDYRFWL